MPYNYVLAINSEIEGRSVIFTIKKNTIQSEFSKNKERSLQIPLDDIYFQLECYTEKFDYLDLYLFFSGKKNTRLPYDFSLVSIDMLFFSQNNCIENKNITAKHYLQNTCWYLGNFKGHISSMQGDVVKITFNFHQTFLSSSYLAFSLSPPSKTPLFKYLNNDIISDSYYQLKNSDKCILLSSYILSLECPFFEKLFQKEWQKPVDSKSALQPLDLPAWTDKAIIFCILHLYTGWLPCTEICKEVFDQLKLVPSDLELDPESLFELLEFAEMLELIPLAYFTSVKAEGLITEKQRSLASKHIKVGGK